MSIEDACIEIKEVISDGYHNEEIELSGEIISAKMVRALIQFGMEWD